MHMVVGLGNPGAKYAGHRHNIGFQLIDGLADEYAASAFSEKFSNHIAECRIAGEKVLLLKPQTYMNNSGRAVQQLLQFYKAKPEHVLVLHDELDLAPGKIRIKQGGGHGGHNGLRDIDAQIGKNYWRLRFGIGHPGHKDQVTSYVLNDFSKQEQAELAPVCDAIIRHFALFYTDTPESFMSKIALASGADKPTTGA